MASFDEKQQDPTIEDDGWQVQDKKKINKKKTSAPTGTTTHVEDKKFERKPFDTKGDAKGAFRTNGESSGISSWRKGAAGTGTTQQTPTKLKDATKPNDTFYVKPSIDDTLSIIAEKLDSVKRVHIPETTQIETPFAQHPYATLLISALYGLKVTDAFSLFYEKAEGDIINTLVRYSFQFPEEIGAPQLQHFTAAQLQELVKLITTNNHISTMHGLLTWAEGSFRQDLHAEFHAHLRVPANALLHSDPIQRDFLSEALVHSYDYASCDVKCDMQTYETTDADKRAQLQSLVLRLVRRPDQSEQELYWLTRPFDNMQVTIWDNMKRNPSKAVCNCFWNPLSPTPTGAWFKLPVSNTSDAFHLFGFDDREYDLHSAVSSVVDKAALPQAKFLRYDAKRHCLQLARNPSHAGVFRYQPESQELQLVWKDNVTMAESNRALSTFLVAKKHQPANAVNVYFDDDFDKLRSSVGHLTGAPWTNTQHSLEQFRACLAFHPFLPIIGVRKPTNDGSDAATACVEALQRVVALLQHCQQPPVQFEAEVEMKATDAFGCEVVLLLNALRDSASVQDQAWKESVVGVPGYSLFSPLERDEWSEVIGFCWLLPVHFYHNVLLPESATWKETWFKRCEELGKQFKVIS